MRRSRTALAAWVLTALAASAAAAGDGPRAIDPGDIPQGNSGIAARYPGDRGIGKDPAVLLFEHFEEGDAGALRKRWRQVDGKFLTFVEDGPEGAAGRTSARFEAQLGRNSGGHLFTYVKGSDVLHARLYAKFERGMGPIHHFCEIRGERDKPGWPMGAAGVVPRGDERFFTMFDFHKKRDKADFTKCTVMFYTYWQYMKGIWGTNFHPKKPFHPQYDKWHCFEWMLKANSSPDAADGEQAMWAEGRCLLRMTGFKWRSTNKLKCNTFWLKYYVTNHSTSVKTNRIRFDNVVVAKSYIGPIAGRAAPKAKPVAEKPPADPAAESRKAEDARAAKMYRSARDAERRGMRPLAKQLYERVVKEYPETAVAKEAAARLDRF